MPSVRKFRPFTMNLMTNVSILFADIAGFTKMSANKSADELVNLLNDLFGQFEFRLFTIQLIGAKAYCSENYLKLNSKLLRSILQADSIICAAGVDSRKSARWATATIVLLAVRSRCLIMPNVA